MSMRGYPTLPLDTNKSKETAIVSLSYISKLEQALLKTYKTHIQMNNHECPFRDFFIPSTKGGSLFDELLRLSNSEDNIEYNISQKYKDQQSNVGQTTQTRGYDQEHRVTSYRLLKHVGTITNTE